MGDEADYMYGYEMDEMAEQYVLSTLPEHFIDIINGYAVERKRVTYQLDNIHKIVLYIPNKKSSDKEMYATYFGTIYNPNMAQSAANILSNLGFRLTRDLVACSLRIENYERDIKRILTAISQYDTTEIKVYMSIQNKNNEKAHCQIKFERSPLTKYKKRLRDFGFRYNNKTMLWQCNRNKISDYEFQDVKNYFKNQEKVRLIQK